MRIETNEKPQNDDGFLQIARQRFKLASEAENSIRKESLEDLMFRLGEQWDQQVKQQRTIDRRPCLVINRVHQFVKQVTNEQRQNKISIKVDPVDDYSDLETAEVIQGIIRHIEISSDAEVAYDTALDCAATMGFGYFRITTDYIGEDSFDQEILIDAIENPFSVYFDPSARKFDYSDAQWAFLVDDLLHDEFKEQFPGSELASLSEFESVGHKAPGWITKDTVRIAEYFYIEIDKRELISIEYPDGRREKVFSNELPDNFEELGMGRILNRRSVNVRSVKWAKINGVEVLERGEWPGRWIPIVPVLGEKVIVDGKKHLMGIVRFAKDPQRMVNYWASKETEAIALAPTAPFIAAEGQLENHEPEWKQANIRNLAVLQYKPVSTDGQLVPPPIRNTMEPPIQAISIARMQAGDDLKAVTGLYDASLGARSNETSGVAIAARQRQGDTATFHIIDNLARSIRHCGRILLDLIPKIYDVPRVQRIIGIDENRRVAQIINDPNQPAKIEETDDIGKIRKIYNVGVGRYDVTVSAGPSYATKRQQAAESMVKMTNSYPQLMAIAGDLMVKNMDWPGASELAERLKKSLPPNMQEDSGDIPPAVQAQLDQLSKEREMLITQLQQLANQIQTKQAESDTRARIEAMKIESNERIEAMKVQAELIQTEAKLRSQEGIELLRQEISQIRDRLEKQAFGESVGVQ